jgi:acetolactate synthase-1/2/3 large subunit
MLAVGARFYHRVTGRLNAFSQGSRKIHIDIDGSSINKNVPVEVPIMADAGNALSALVSAWQASHEPTDPVALASWWRQIDEWRTKDSLKFNQDMARGGIIKPQYAIQRLFEITQARRKEVFITTEGGQH